MKKKLNQKGQILIALVLIMLTLLTVGLIIIQRSTVDVTTSTQNDQSSRAFSAAEAGVEQALQAQLTNGQYIGSQPLTNNSDYYVTTSAALPLTGQALEYRSATKEEPAQFWLVDPNTDFSGTVTPVYTKEGIFIYFGDAKASSANKNLPALEISLITYDSNTKAISAARTYVDTDTTRVATNKFFECTSSDENIKLNPPPINTSLNTNGTGTSDSTFKCRVRINTLYNGGNIIPIMIRARLLYENAQAIAVAPDTGGSLPPQQTIYTSIGTSGQARKTIQVVKENNVVPFFFDYAIYSAADIIKN